jgi:hypothetical protein
MKVIGIPVSTRFSKGIAAIKATKAKAAESFIFGNLNV